MTDKEAESSVKPRVRRSRSKRLARSISDPEPTLDVHDIANSISSSVNRAIYDFQEISQNPNTSHEALLRGTDNLLLTNMMARIGMKLLESVESIPQIALEDPKNK